MKVWMLAACLALQTLPAISQGVSQDVLSLRYGHNAAAAGGLSSLPVNLAIRKGFFDREKLVVTVVPIPGGTDRIVAALDKGEIDAGKNATPYLIQAVLKGSDAVAVMAQTANPVYSLIVQPEIKSFADLKGKTVGLSTPGDTITLASVRLMASKGLASADFKAKAVVGSPARFDCLKSGECAAVPMGQPEDTDAIAQGYPRLAFTSEAGADLLFNVDMVRRAWGLEHKDALVRFVRAMAASYAFLNDPQNRTEVVKIIAENGKISQQAADNVFAPYLEADKNVLPKRGEISVAAFDRVLGLMAQAGVVPTPAPDAARFVDLQYLKAAGIGE